MQIEELKNLANGIKKLIKMTHLKLFSYGDFENDQ